MRSVWSKGHSSFQVRLARVGLFLVQIFVYAIYAPPCRLVYRVERDFRSSIDGMERGSLLIANHVSVADPFVILAHVPFRTFLRLVPIYFPVDPDYFRRLFFRLWLPMLGGYDAGRTPKEKFLMIIRTRDFLRRGETVFLFPEGKINSKMIGEFERGIEYFAREAKSVALIKTDGLLLRPKEFVSDYRRITFLGVKTFQKNDTVFARELRSMFFEA